MFNLFGKSDEQLKTDVIEEIAWDPSVNDANVEVSARDGVIVLNGHVPHLVEKLAAEQAAFRVTGVKAVADDLKVIGSFEKSDEEIAQAALTALAWSYSVPKGVKVTVEDGWITMDGEVSWNFQRESAYRALVGLLAVKGVTNRIVLKTQPTSDDVKHRIEESLRRTAKSESSQITVRMKGEKVILAGKAHSNGAIQDAWLAAWMAPGVTEVENKIDLV